MLTPVMAFRNVFRQKRRSLLTGLTMLGGFVLLSVGTSIFIGSFDTSIRAFTDSSTGHIQVHRTGYRDRPTLYQTFQPGPELDTQIRSLSEVVSWAPRVYSGALAFLGKQTTPVRLIGIDPQLESQTTRLKERIASGRFLDDLTAKEVVVGSGLIERLNARIGGTLVVISQGADGSIANDLFTVVGVLRGGPGSSDYLGCYLPLAAAQDFLVLHGQVHEMAVRLKHYSQSQSTAQHLTDRLHRPDLEVAPWEVVESYFYKIMVNKQNGMWIILLIIVAIVAIGVLNTVLMAILERTREYGVLKALGTRPGRVFGLILLETAYLAAMACTLGLGLSWWINGYLAHTGIRYPTTFYLNGIPLDRVFGSLDPMGFYLPTLVILCTALLVSVIPAVHAARVRPAAAIQR